ncbi:MAG TPA: hypothetical protein EYQ14_01285 [Gammaproteobacteria bacterium]|nr:hypothetical protein [Gammaproteobacteria bacterium]HIL97310.1 hypothetical protein [Pseudomonadales bacterium]
MMSSVTSGLADDLAETILNSNDIETVREGIPAYLLMVDSFLRSSPDNSDLLLAASSLNGAFSIFTTEARSEILTTKSLDYASRAACIENKTLCGFRELRFKEYTGIVDGLDKTDTRVAYALGVAWTGWMQAHSSDFNAIAQLGKVKYLMAKIVLLDENYDNGGPHLYLGGLETALPPSMGGRFDEGRMHFEKAIELSGGKFLMAKVMFAELYAKQAFDKELHDQLLNEVLAADPEVEGMVLTNMFAQQQAEELLAESDDYF